MERLVDRALILNYDAHNDVNKIYIRISSVEWENTLVMQITCYSQIDKLDNLFVYYKRY